MGTPDFAMEALRYAYENTELKLVITKEDKANLRGKKIQFSPVKEFAIKNNIRYIQPKSIRSEEVIDLIKSLDVDLIIVAAYGKIIPKSLIDLPKYGIINVHSSLLPKYRGAAPIQAALRQGDKKTGVTIMQIDEGLDTGDILSMSEVDILESDNLVTLTTKLSKLSYGLLKDTVNDIVLGKVTKIKQDDSKASIVKLIKKEEANINWSNSTEDIFNLIRAIYSNPTAYTSINNKRIKIYESKKIDKKYDSVGVVVDLIKDGPVISTKDGALLITLAQFEGKKQEKGRDIVNGRKLKIGDKCHGY